MDADDKLAATSFKAQTTVAILPLGQVDETELEFLAYVLRNFFSLQTKLMSVVTVPRKFYRPKRKQYDADQLLDYVLSYKPKRAGMIVGVFNGSLFSENIKKILGLAYLTNGSMIYSTKDLHEDCTDISKKQKRSEWIILHEMGHVFGFDHCPVDNCALNEFCDYDYVDETKPTYCLKCLEKITINVAKLLSEKLPPK